MFLSSSDMRRIRKAARLTASFAGGAKLGSGSLVALQFFAPKTLQPLVWGEKPVASLRAKKAKGGGMMVCLDIHPPGLTGAGAEHVADYVLGGVLNRAHWEIAAAKVTRVDIALDLHGVRLDDFAWDVRGKRIRRPFVNAPNLRSLGFGSPKHGAVAIYDRTGKDGHEASQPWTRVEARMKPGCALKDLPAAANPLVRIDVTDVRAAWKQLGRNRIEAEAMLAMAQLRGPKALAAVFPKDTPQPIGTIVGKSLAGATPSWWSPMAAWEAFPQALASALPAKETIIAGAGAI